MQLELTRNSTTSTVLRIPDGRAVYHIKTPGLFTRKTTTIYKIPEMKSQRYQDAKKMHDVEPNPEEEIARIHWHNVQNSRLIWEGRAYDVQDILKSKHAWFEKKHFTGPDGKNYRWSISSGTAKVKIDDGSKPAPVVVNTYQGNIFKRKQPALEVDDSVTFMLDLIVITWVYMETKRRDAEAAAAAAA
ncbi:hypothetical protein QCA50_019978 [Cerrena zonata]|uniref:DUF6593 domain-containing protein n=1 Tax=Cerrena zonata TaxID=2478898 RepID=A0AAW0FKB6_9APHY